MKIIIYIVQDWFHWNERNERMKKKKHKSTMLKQPNHYI